MATRDINEYLESGEVDGVKKGGTTDEDTLKDKAEIDALIASVTDPIDARVQNLEEGHTVVLNAKSPLASQEPAGLNSPLQLTFGPAQGTVSDPVMLSAAGALTFNTTDKYIINIRAHYGRTGAAGTSILMFRVLKNGLAIGDTFATKIDSADILVPWDSSSFIFNATAGDVLTTQIIRDGAGADAGGLFAQASTAGWVTAPCCAASIYKV